MRVPTVEFRHAGDKYADLIQEAIDNLGLDFNDVKFVTPEDDPAPRRPGHQWGITTPLPRGHCRCYRSAQCSVRPRCLVVIDAPMMPQLKQSGSNLWL